MLTRAQLRGGRAMLDWSATELARRSGVHRHIIRKIERGLTDPQRKTAKAIVGALSNAGVEFVENGVVLRDAT